jgi:molybdopterin/thiamine biosynthesis adenylyltransferase/rhodanese-related sulfurtransferase
MLSYRDLLKKTRDEITEIDSSTARDLNGNALFVDVREREEWDEGHIPGAVHVPRGNLESRIEGVAPEREKKVVLYCASGARSAFAAKTLAELGYADVVSLQGGFSDWKRNGYDVQLPRMLTPEKRARYARHVAIPEIGEEGQLKLLDSKMLILGAGGLGSPAALYLAAAGVGHIGIIDADIVDESNLQRQIAHSLNTLGSPKVDSAKRAIEALNPDIEVTTYRERLSSENIERILADGWEMIVDGTDNFPTRYLVNDASVWHDIPVVHGSIYRFEGQVTVFKPGRAGSAAGEANGARPEERGPCYRCLYPAPPPPELAPSCAEGGVLGVLPGIVGTLQTNEALKLALGVGDPLIGRLLLFDALATDFTEVRLKRNPECPVCGDHPTITEYIDYVEFCTR